MNNVQLQYASLKSVILFMEPNVRLHLTCRLPSIRTAEKGTPLKIDNIRFEDNTIVVNDTEYQLSVYRKYHVEKPPVEVSGTVEHDLDEYGFKQPASNDLLPGDVRISTPTRRGIPSYSEDDIKMALRNELFRYEWELEKFRATQDGSFDYDDRMLNGLRQRMLSFDYRRNQQKSPCDLCLQLTIWNNSIIQNTYRMPHYEKLHIGMKQLMEMLFGKRQDVWTVNHMHLDVPILRWLVSGTLPVVRKLSIEDLKSTNMEALKSCIHTLSFPLNGLQIDGSFGNWPFEIQNSNVSINSRILPIHFSWWVSHWLRHGRPIGTCFTFDFQHVEPSDWFDGISTFPEVMERSERFVKLSMRNSLVLVVSKKERIVVVNGVNKLYWTVEMKVVHAD